MQPTALNPNTRFRFSVFEILLFTTHVALCFAIWNHVNQSYDWWQLIWCGVWQWGSAALIVTAAALLCFSSCQAIAPGFLIAGWLLAAVDFCHGCESLYLVLGRFSSSEVREGVGVVALSSVLLPTFLTPPLLYILIRHKRWRPTWPEWVSIAAVGITFFDLAIIGYLIHDTADDIERRWPSNWF